MFPVLEVRCDWSVLGDSPIYLGKQKDFCLLIFLEVGQPCIGELCGEAEQMFKHHYTL